ncbi:hypothetical protein CHUAL_005286 [Chamberlinius hualienensis]
MMTSTLVETVSINYEDFNESFLTCGTCLCGYDGQEHTPKLLACSHTVCRQCLERIASNQPRDTGTFRCPICRETITVPRGGVSALPPSFLVNQLLDLMARQRREVIPKCSNHHNQELLFCETCDCVFCTECTGEQHGGCGDGRSCEHTVIPFSIAIKRMSEILLYKAHQCIGKLNQACENVTQEINKLDNNAEHTFEMISQSFQELIAICDKRRQELLGQAKKTRDEKKKVLQEQLALINAEKAKVESECDGLQYQVEVRNITKKISDLNDKLEQVATLLEPRENCFIKYEYKHNDAIEQVQSAVEQFGQIHISKTFPALCTAELSSTAIAHLMTSLTVTTVDYHGDTRTSGGDPVSATVTPCRDTSSLLKVTIADCKDGTYQVQFTPQNVGKHQIRTTIFDRPIKSVPLIIDVDEHNSPVKIFGCKGSGIDCLNQPVDIAFDMKKDEIYVTDTANSRIKVLNSDLAFIRHLESAGVEERGGIGVSIGVSGETLVVVNWRSKLVSEIQSEDGQLVKQFSHKDLIEPIAIAVNSAGEILVADNGVGAVFVFDNSGKLLNKIGRGKGTSPGCFELISSVAIGKNDDILVADSRIQVFSKTGEFLRSMIGDEKTKGKYGGVTFDDESQLILASRTEKTNTFIQVFNYDGEPLFNIDSYGSKLKRPSGLTIAKGGHVVIVDLGNDCIKKFRYK